MLKRDREDEAKKRTVIRPEPLHILGLGPAPRHQPIPLVLVGIPGELVAAAPEALGRHLERRQREDDVVGRDAAIVDHAGEGGPEPDLFLHPAVAGSDGPDGHVGRAVGCVAARLVREADHVARARVELGVRREGRRRDLALKVVPAQGRERRRVQRERWAVLLARQQHPAPERDVGVGRGPDHPAHALVVRVGVAVPPEQAAPRGRLGQVAVRLYCSELDRSSH